MKGLAIDSAVSRLTIAAKNDDKICTAIYDIGMKQSETLVPAIDYVLSKTGMEKSELEYGVFCIGPGSFTGLRLGIAAIKAIELAFNIPIYGISSLRTYAYPYLSFDTQVLSCIDANKDKFYASIYKDGKEILSEGDYDIDFIIEKICADTKVLIAGPDAKKFESILKEKEINIKTLVPETNSNTAEALFAIAEKEIAAKNPGMKDYDGPVYLRASEAELKLNQN
ncbi:MAG: tRNA (adenosine(37)-N6)-threonylcarbamoyltransferase complex dimerization subunit type 1 TsaB [Treponema sp.]|nr:tRNA (adenosine(37)-N6)-threonylcarbamoyltransferase complex dimerization subunit type 1 TsaB [Treponema sp.]